MFANLYHLQIPYIFTVFYYAFPFPTKQTKSPQFYAVGFYAPLKRLSRFCT